MSEIKCSYRIAYEKQKKRAERAEAENAEFRLANQVMHGAYLRIRKLLSAWNTPTAPTTEQVHEYVEDCVRAIVNENAAAQSTIADLQATVERLREALQAVEVWDLNWAEGLDANVERIKNKVHTALSESL